MIDCSLGNENNSTKAERQTGKSKGGPSADHRLSCNIPCSAGELEVTPFRKFLAAQIPRHLQKEKKISTTTETQWRKGDHPSPLKPSHPTAPQAQSPRPAPARRAPA